MDNAPQFWNNFLMSLFKLRLHLLNFIQWPHRGSLKRISSYHIKAHLTCYLGLLSMILYLFGCACLKNNMNTLPKVLPAWGILYFSSAKAVVDSVWLGGWSENKVPWENMIILMVFKVQALSSQMNLHCYELEYQRGKLPNGTVQSLRFLFNGVISRNRIFYLHTYLACNFKFAGSFSHCTLFSFLLLLTRNPSENISSNCTPSWMLHYFEISPAKVYILGLHYIWFISHTKF